MRNADHDGSWTVQMSSEYRTDDPMPPADAAPVLRAVLDRRDVLTVPPVWASRARCYHALAQQLTQLTLVISPFLARMQEEISALAAQDIPATLLHAGLSAYELELRLIRMMRMHFRVIYLSPGLMGRPEISRLFRMASHFSLIVVNDAHCLSMYSSHYRPIYAAVPDFLDNFGPHRPPVLALCIPSVSPVEDEIRRRLRLRNPLLLRAALLRSNLFYAVYRTGRKDAFLLHFLQRHAGECGIIYCLHAERAVQLLQLLRRNGFHAFSYHAELGPMEKSEQLRRFCSEKAAAVLVAVPDAYLELVRPNLRFILHDAMPPNLERYYQETDRAGWDSQPAECVLLFNEQDFTAQKKALQKTQQRYLQTPDILQHLQNELEAMRRYTETHRCLRSFLLNYFERAEAAEADNCCINCNTERFTQKEYDSIRVPRPEKEAVMPAPAARDRRKKEVQADAASDYDSLPAQTSTGNELPAEIRMQLLRRLRMLRLQRAQAQHVPAGQILPDRSLLEICRRLPQTQAEFSEIYGIGPAKSELYWEHCAAEIRRAQEPGYAVELYEAARETSKRPEPDRPKTGKTPFHLTEAELRAFRCEDGLRSPELAQRLNALASDETRPKLHGAAIERRLSALGDLECRCVEIAGRVQQVYLPTRQGEAAGICSGRRRSRNGTEYPAAFYSAAASQRIARLFLDTGERPDH